MTHPMVAGKKDRLNVGIIVRRRDTLANGMHLAQIKGKMRFMKVSIPIKLFSFFNIHSLFMYI